MDDRTGRDDRSYLSPTAHPGEMADDDPPEKAVHPTSTLRSDFDQGGVETPYRRRLYDEEMVQRVGGRRRVRPELVLTIAGSVFIVAALLKPWQTPCLPASRRRSLRYRLRWRS